MTRLRDKISVEPLDELTVARVERKLLSSIEPAGVAPAHRSWLSASVRWAAPAVAVAGVALAVFLNVRGSMTATSSTVAVVETDAPPATLSTGEEPARLAIDGAEIVLGANARADVIRHADGSTTVVLAQGRVDCEVEPRENRPPFVVAAGEVEVTVVGTVFAVERDGDDVKVEVTRGRVEVSNASGRRRVAAGQRWADSSDDAVALAAAVPAEPATAAQEPAKPTVVAAAPEKPTTREAKTRDRSRSRSSDEVQTPKPADEQTGPVTLTRPPRGTAPDELEDIRALETRDPKAAANRYFAVAYNTDFTGRIASYAMYSLAYLQMFELGQPAKAIETAGHYERRFRKGRESRAAMWLKVRAICKVDDDAACRDAARSYVARYPSGRHADQARWLIRR